MGHVLASGSNDHTVKFWVRNRVGDTMGCKPEVRKAHLDQPSSVQAREERGGGAAR